MVLLTIYQLFTGYLSMVLLIICRWFYWLHWYTKKTFKLFQICELIECFYPAELKNELSFSLSREDFLQH